VQIRADGVMRDNASELTKCIAANSRHLDDILRPFVLRQPEWEARWTSEMKETARILLRQSALLYKFFTRLRAISPAK